jgi:putative endonuclease
MSSWWVYILRCADRTLYTGVTTDLDRRLDEHNNGKGGAYTRVRRPVKRVYEEPAASRSEAQAREAAIKKLSRTEKLALIRTR